MKDRGRHEETFSQRITRASRDRSSRIILALDIPDRPADVLIKRARILLKKTLPYLCGVKFHRHTILTLGTNRILRIVKQIHAEDLPCIVDDKLNDIGSTNTAIAEAYFRLGMDALTANPFVGWKGGLEPLFKNAHGQGKGVLLLVYMSHLGASEGYSRKVVEGRSSRLQYILFAEKAKTWKADGAIVGATRPTVIREVRRILGNRIPIYSPGVGTQGGNLTTALKAGSNFFIVGRSITKSPSPARMAASLAELSMSR